MVGLIKACVRVVSRGSGGKTQKPSSSSPKQQQPPSPPAYVKVACLLGLRVSPSHRYGDTPSTTSFCFFNFHHMRVGCMHTTHCVHFFAPHQRTFSACLIARRRVGPPVRPVGRSPLRTVLEAQPPPPPPPSSHGLKNDCVCVLTLIALFLCRRLGIATALVERAEEWCRERGASHATMATTTSNAASLALFTGRFGYAPFRRPEFLGRPVHAHRLPIPSTHRVYQLPPPLAAAAYARLSPPHATEFLPADMPALLAHKLTLGTFVAIESGPERDPSAPPSFAVLSVWDSTRSMRLRVRGAPALLRASLAALRALDRGAPWMRVPSIPDIFRPFGAYLLYGLRMSGPAGPDLLRSLCHHAHNVARKNPDCAVVAADVAPDDPAAAAVPRWRRFSCDEDVWCIKNLSKNADDDDGWAAPAPSGTVLFVDPREF